MGRILSESIPLGQVTHYEFLKRFTVGERITIRSSTNPVIQDFLDLLSKVKDVNLTFTETIQGVYYLEEQNLISVGRASEILDISDL